MATIGTHRTACATRSRAGPVAAGSQPMTDSGKLGRRRIGRQAILAAAGVVVVSPFAAAAWGYDPRLAGGAAIRGQCPSPGPCDPGGPGERPTRRPGQVVFPPSPGQAVRLDSSAIAPATKIRTNPYSRFGPATADRGSRGIRVQPRNSPKYTEKRIRINFPFPCPSRGQLPPVGWGRSVVTRL
jgi:hypothetical protein